MVPASSFPADSVRGQALFDMHCHLDFAADVRAAAQKAAEVRGAVFFSSTMDPFSYPASAQAFAQCPHVHVGLGWHPWRVPSDAFGLEEGLAAFDRAARQTDVRLFGEVGLDYGRAHAANSRNQRVAFDRVLRFAAQRPGSVVSIHCVRAYDDALGLIEASGAAHAGTCIFHWFSGSSDQLGRAIAAGCLFSVGERMLATKRGRAYARAIPANRLLLETDLPGEPEISGDGADAVFQVVESLARAADALAALRGGDIAAQMAETSRRALAAATVRAMCAADAGSVEVPCAGGNEPVHSPLMP